MTFRVRVAAVGLALSIVGVSRHPTVQGQEPRMVRVAAVTSSDLRSWDAHVDRLIRTGALELRQERQDTLVAGRRHLRFTQMVDGVPVYGADLARQSDGNGVTVSMFGTLYEGIAISTAPKLTAEEAQQVVTRLTGAELGADRRPKLTILPRAGNVFTLVYQVRVATPEDITLYFIDAATGGIVHQRSDAHRQSAVGVGTGVLGDQKKVQALAQGGAFVESDQNRPPDIETYDMRGSLARTISVLNGVVRLGASDFATDSDNTWTDGANVDAHTYAGYTYDYFYKRFGRLGLDNANIRIRSLTHPVNRSDAFTASPNVLFTFFVNAFYAGDGLMVYGEGLPPNARLGGQSWNWMAGSLDVVGHELTHGVTDYSSQLIYENESGALNEAFSDIMATGIEFFFQPAGTGLNQAEYLIGEDVVTPGGIRSMSDPRTFGDPDHYSIRFTGDEDNGGVHINSGIPNNAYYLAIEGGANRTSGLSVQGIGRANREQIEKVFYRAFAQLMPANATFSTARAVTIQAARDLYPSNGAVERAVTEAWTAVGVN
jgi:bacillolysin